MISKRRRLGNDGHNMYVMTKTSSGTKESDSYEKDIRLAKRAVDSGMTKKRISTRRSFDNSRMRRALMDAYRRYVLFDAEESDTEAFRHNGTVNLSNLACISVGNAFQSASLELTITPEI